MYRCLESKWAALEKRVKSMERKLNKYGMTLHFKEVKRELTELPVIDYVNYDYAKNVGTQIVELVYYDFEMPMLKLGEYEVVAVLEHHKTDGVLIFGTRDEGIPREYYEAKPVCDHCNTSRYRKHTVVLKNEKGQYKQVGKTCLKEYLGITDTQVLSLYQDIYALEIVYSDIPYTDYSKGDYPKYYKTLNYLDACIEEIKANGYRPTDMSESTKVQASKKYQEATVDPLTETVLEFFRNLEVTNEFEHNLKVSLADEFTSVSGFIAYAYEYYKKALVNEKHKKKQAAQADLSEYFGTVGDRITIEATVTLLHVIDGYYGTSVIAIFEDDANHVFKWNCSNPRLLYAYEIGSTVKFKGTISEHSEYKGTKQTVLKRCVFEGTETEAKN